MATRSISTFKRICHVIMIILTCFILLKCVMNYIKHRTAPSVQLHDGAQAVYNWMNEKVSPPRSLYLSMVEVKPNGEQVPIHINQMETQNPRRLSVEYEIGEGNVGITENDQESRQMFTEWKTAFNKDYANTEEETQRYNNFMKNWKMIQEFNNGEESFTMNMNEFGDLNENEFQNQVNGRTGSCLLTPEGTFTDINEGSQHDQNTKSETPEDVPLSMDWTNINSRSYVTDVKTQGFCGSCWAFSTTGAIESRASIAQGLTGDEVINLSEQELIDCSGSYGNRGCNGGFMENAFSYVAANGGLCTEKDYPYTGITGEICKASQCGKKYDPITLHEDNAAISFSSLEAALVQGPVAVSIKANLMPLRFYHEGIFTAKCGPRLDHGVLLVGYGETDGQKWWKIKNSWGETWGEDGYARICRRCGMNEGKGECGILMEPSYPLVPGSTS